LKTLGQIGPRAVRERVKRNKALPVDLLPEASTGPAPACSYLPALCDKHMQLSLYIILTFTQNSFHDLVELEIDGQL
jgi:hypothetical protein